MRIMPNHNPFFPKAWISRRRFLRLGGAALLTALGPASAIAGRDDAPALSPDAEVVLVSALGFVKLHARPVSLPHKARDYLLYGNLATRRMLVQKAVRPHADLLKACVRDWPAFAGRVRQDVLDLFYPAPSGDPLTRLTPYAAIGLSVRLAAAKLRYDFGVAALAGNDDVDGDGRGDGLNREMLARLSSPEVKNLAATDPARLRRRYAKRAQALDAMSIDEIYNGGVGVCRHQTLVAMAVFRVFKELAPSLANLYLSGLASLKDRHQWLMAAAVEPDKVTLAFYDPTASSRDRARAVRAFTDRGGEARYIGIPDEHEARRLLGLD